MRRTIVLLTVSLAGVLSAAALGRVEAMQTLSADEKAVAAHVDAHDAEGIALLEKIVNINSGTQNLDGVKQVGAVLRAGHAEAAALL